MARTADRYVVDFPTLWIVPAWIQRHCIVADSFLKGSPFKMYDWQLWCTLNHYRVKPDAVAYDANGYPTRGAAFFYRRSQIVGPQKTGKGPWSATIVCAEAVGPVLFAGWAEAGDVYDCEDHGCHCGWRYTYRPGEPKGMPWPTPLIQLLATSEDQVDNVYRHLKAMARHDRLSGQMKVREGFIRVNEDGIVEIVTSSAQSRLGNPTIFCLQDESQLYTETNKMRRVAETMRRGVAGMGGRSMETTNPWDPSEQSVAQRTHEGQAKDVFKYYEPPPAKLSFTNKAERRRIFAFNYAGSPHASVDMMLAEAAELIETDPGQAERFYGNRIVAGMGSWLEGPKWDDRAKKRTLPRGTQIVVGFDGSDVDDWTALRAETRDGYQFTPTFGPDKQPTIWNPGSFNGRVPRLEVRAAIDEIFEYFDVVRFYIDPPYWETEADALAEEYGDKRVIRWETYRPVQMHAAAERMLTDVNKADSNFTHDGCAITKIHVRNARKAPRPNQRYVLAKASQQQKIDSCVASIICHEAAGDVTAADAWLTASFVYFR